MESEDFGWKDRDRILPVIDMGQGEVGVDVIRKVLVANLRGSS